MGRSGKPGKLKKKPFCASSAAGATLDETRTETTAGETFWTMSAKLGTCCGLSMRTASASTGAVPVATAPKPIAPAIASEATAAISRLRVFETLDFVSFSISVVLLKGMLAHRSQAEIVLPTLRSHFRRVKIS